MKRHALVVLAIMAALLVVFGVLRAANIDVLVDPRPAFDRLGALAVLAAVGLLVADVALPVPSSLVMIWLGANVGWAGGAALSLVGCVGATALAFAVGRRGGRMFERIVPWPERARANAFLARWGAVAVALTRGVPIIAETTTIVAGSSPAMRWPPVIVAALVGGAPWAVAYGLVGAALA